MMMHKGKFILRFLLTTLLYAAISCVLCIGAKDYLDYVEAKIAEEIYQGMPTLQETTAFAWVEDTTGEQTGEGRALPEYGMQYATISCERVGLKAPLYYGDDKETLLLGVGQYPSGKLPGQNETIIVGGHDSTYFKTLEEIVTGDIVEIAWNQTRKSYEVKDLRICEVDDVSAYELNQTGEVLILYTCYPFQELNTERMQRYYVYCYPVVQE